MKKTYYLFSQYTGPEEKLVGSFFAKISETSSVGNSVGYLSFLLQENIITFNLWSESKYKGYKYLNKLTRKELYQKAALLVEDFNKYEEANYLFYENTPELVKKMYPDLRLLEDDRKKIIHLQLIMAYLSPQNNIYKYRESSTFGELLKDPMKSKITGDCNQIVTLYIYFYSLKFDITDLKLGVSPGHVALHFNGLDIEATTGQFVNKQNKNTSLLPIYEIASINLLDITDSYFKTHKIDSLCLLQVARFAYIISSQRNIVAKNLEIAYRDVVAERLQANDYSSTIAYAKKSGNKKLLNFAAQQSVDYYLRVNNFGLANKYTQYVSDHGKDLRERVTRAEGVYFYNKGNYEQAIVIFKRLKEPELIRKCYIAMFEKERNNLGKVTTVDDIRNKKNIIQKMSTYANKSNDKALIKYTDYLKKYL